jgi:hypothetical protein
MIPGSRGPVAVRLPSIPGGGLEKSRPGSLPGTATVVDKHLGRGYSGSSFNSCELTPRNLRGTQRHGFIAPDHHKGELEHSLCIWVPRCLYDQSYRVVPMTKLTRDPRPGDFLQQRWLTKHYGEANVSSYNVITCQAKKNTIERNMTNDCANFFVIKFIYENRY